MSLQELFYIANISLFLFGCIAFAFFIVKSVKQSKRELSPLGAFREDEWIPIVGIFNVPQHVVLFVTNSDDKYAFAHFDSGKWFEWATKENCTFFCVNRELNFIPEFYKQTIRYKGGDK